MWNVSTLVGVLFVGLFVIGVSPAAQETAVDFQGPAAEEFLREARISRMQGIAQGVTAPRKATLVRGDATRFGAFKTVDINRPGLMRMADGTVEINFQDSWRPEVAAYEIDKMIGLRMVPATVERSYRGDAGSLQWWVESEWPEAERRRQNIVPSDPVAWNRENLNMALFDNLIYNNDRHLNNVLVTKTFELRLIDHSRAFRSLSELKSPEALTGFSRDLLAGIERLTRGDLQKRVGRFLGPVQIAALIARRDLILARARALAAEKGESVLY